MQHLKKVGLNYSFPLLIIDLFQVTYSKPPKTLVAKKTWISPDATGHLGYFGMHWFGLGWTVQDGPHSSSSWWASWSGERAKLRFLPLKKGKPGFFTSSQSSKKWHDWENSKVHGHFKSLFVTQGQKQVIWLSLESV